jgi:hypothetical protein
MNEVGVDYMLSKELFSNLCPELHSDELKIVLP